MQYFLQRKRQTPWITYQQSEINHSNIVQSYQISPMAIQKLNEQKLPKNTMEKLKRLQSVKLLVFVLPFLCGWRPVPLVPPFLLRSACKKASLRVLAQGGTLRLGI